MLTRGPPSFGADIYVLSTYYLIYVGGAFMRTYKPLSTISYNSRPFLTCTLNSLIDQGIISFWVFIPHHGEGKRKDHIHVYVEPCSTIDTDSMAFRSCFDEPDLTNDKPLSCEPWRKSKFEDWALYCQHDSAYLAAKGLFKEYCDYPLSSFVSSDSELFAARESEINRDKYNSPMQKMVDCFANGMSLIQAMSYLRIPYGSMHSFITAWNELQKNVK